MKRARLVTVAATALMVGGIGASVLLARVIANMQVRDQGTDVLYLSSAKVLKRLSLGYEGLMADIYWTRAVQYYGSEHAFGGGEYKLLLPLLNIATQLDPQLIPAYEFGGTFVATRPPNGAGLPDKAIALLESGIQNNPENWHLYYDLAFIYYDLKDYKSSSEAFLRGSKVPHAHPFLTILAARMAEHGGELETARVLWSTTYQTTKDKDIRANAAAHLRALQAAEDVTELEKRIEIYRQRSGHFPSSFEDMVKSGLLYRVPKDPMGKAFRMGPDGKVFVTDPDDLPFLEKGLPPGYVPGPPKIRPVD